MNCLSCKIGFIPKQKFCSDKCRNKHFFNGSVENREEKETPTESLPTEALNPMALEDKSTEPLGILDRLSIKRPSKVSKNGKPTS